MSQHQSAYWATATNSAAAATSNESRSRRRKSGRLSDSPRHRSEGAREHSDRRSHHDYRSSSHGYSSSPLRSSAPVTTVTYVPTAATSYPADYSSQLPDFSSLSIAEPQAQSNMFLQPSYPTQWGSQWSNSQSYVQPTATYSPIEDTSSRPYSYHPRTAPSPPQQYQPYRPASSSRGRSATPDRIPTEDTYVNPTEATLFAAALSGFSDTTPFSLTSASPQSSSPQPTAFTASALSSRTPPLLQTQSSYQHPPFAYQSSGTNSLVPPPSRGSDTRSPSQMFAEQLLMMGDDDDRPPDEELPDYATSQAEEAKKRRVEAERRARELEMRWKAGRRG